LYFCKEYLEKINVTGKRQKANDGEEWVSAVEETKLLTGVYSQEVRDKYISITAFNQAVRHSGI
jgi:hypothetical protein